MGHTAPPGGQFESFKLNESVVCMDYWTLEQPNDMMCHLLFTLCCVQISWSNWLVDRLTFFKILSSHHFRSMSALRFIFSLFFFQDGFVRVRTRDLEKLTTEVMQLREFLPRVLNGDLIRMLHKARAAQTSMLPLTWTLRQKITFMVVVSYLVTVRQE